jgi:isocitrate dehydrogenase (NAD+)
VIHLRKALNTHTIVRRVSNLPGLPARAQGIDLVIVREASEDIYAGFEHQTSEGVFETVKVTTRAACERVSTFAFEYARGNGRKKVTTVHKANILKKADGMFLKVSQEIAAKYPDIQHEEVIVDALCMKLVRWPQSFDVLLCGNLFGDIVSDCAAGMAGGITVAGGVQLGEGVALFESPHPDVGNPYPLLRVTGQLLRHLKEDEAAERLEKAIIGALEAGVHTPDMGGSASAQDVERAVLLRMYLE